MQTKNFYGFVKAPESVVGFQILFQSVVLVGYFYH